ncbi:autotransporter-associated beta strand protein [Luteibacter rhizovicinus]|uniref:Autotransporter-associated beta strand protein n=1 Tax=Luteibacter rhizovicinus TaxID=242606 RepID=A0A4R3Z071_9GAMM|nr:autotransporter serine protease [Luteibacter rhizovicinus]TCV97073.1 autotransporter-associated beta strand protein [Luteibacter rhizovicinus]
MNVVIAPRRRELTLAICVAFGVTACGGGGSGATRPVGLPSTPSTPAPPTNPTPPPVQPPLDAQLRLTNTTAAHAAGFTGQGVTIGIVDSGVTRTHPSLVGRVISNLNYVDPSTNNLGVDDVVGHGTAVAQIAAGRPFGQFPGGIAPDAQIISARIVSDKAPTDDGSGQGTKVTSADPLQTVNVNLYNAGVRAMNNSWGGLYWDATDAATTKSFHDAYALFVSKGLVVFAAGNDGKPNPSDVAALPSRAPDLATGWLTVVALDSNNPTQLASYSNRCGIAMSYCLAAPGSVITTGTKDTSANPSYAIWTGTSLAAPQVTGAVAVVWSAFPSFSNDAVRQIILGTADDLGAAGPDAVFGYGSLDVGRAVRGPAKLDWGTFNADMGGRNAEFANDISGAGKLSVNGPGTLTLSGQNTYLGGTAVTGGAILDARKALPGVLGILGSTAIARGDIGGSVTNSGTLQTDNVAVHVGGDYTQGAAGRLSQKLGAPLLVGGAATLNGDFQVAGAVPGYVVTSHQSVLTAGKGVQGKFASTSLAQGVFLSSTLNYLPTEVWVDTTSLSVTQVATQSMSASPVALASAQRLDGAFQQINQNLAGSSASTASLDQKLLLAAGSIQQSPTTRVAQASLESLSGQLHAASTAVTFAGIDASNDALMAHFDQMSGGGAWMQSLGHQGSLSRGGFGNVGFALDGGLVGSDIRLGNSGFAGMAIGQSSSIGQLADSADRSRSRGTEGMFYAGTRGSHWYGVGRVGFGSYRENMQRMLQLGEQAAFVGSDATGRYNVAYGEFGYRADTNAFAFMPFMNLQYASIRRSAFQESGGDGFGLSANAQTTSRWQAGIGVRGGRSWLTSWGTIRLDARLGWQNAFATRGEVFSARYTGIAQWAPVEGIGLSRRAGTAGVTLGWQMSPRTQFGFNVDQRLADRDNSRSASATFRMVW